MQRIGGYVAGRDGDAGDEIDDLVATLTAHIDDTIDVLESSGVFNVLSVTLTTNYANQINHARRIRANYDDQLSETTLGALARLIDRLQEVDVARQYFKNIYLQDELSSLSRVLLYAGIPAEVFSVVVLLSFTASTPTPLTANGDVLLPVSLTVAFLPLAVLFAFILRTATVTQRTAATIPITTPEQER